MTTKKEIITKNMSIGEIIRKYPKSSEIIIKHGMNCIGCHVATWETLEQGAAGHGIDVDELVKELNKKMRLK